VPIVDIFSELHLTEDTDKFRGLWVRLVMEKISTIRLKIAYRIIVAEARIEYRDASESKWVPSGMEAYLLI
jgi:hypothetical protein